MNKRVSLGAALAALLMVAAVTFSMTWIYARNTFNQRVTDLTEREQMFEKFAEINKHVRNNFYGSINNTLLMDNVARGYMEGIDDKYSTYITAEEYKKRTQSEEEYVGIGAVIEQAPDDFYLVVTEVYPDSPAQVAGIEAGDLIVKIDDTDLTRENSRQMLESIVGPQGSRITMVTRRGSEERPLVEMTRRAITIPTVEAHMMEQASPDEPLVGYIRIMEFGERTYDQFNRELQRLMDAGAQSLIFDVRDNSGGVMRSATRILDKLLPDGVLLSALHKDGTVEVQATSDANAINLPMTVLVNGGSESAAELFAQVIRDYEKGHIVGAVTAGKGVMQSTIRLSDGSAIELTVALYQTKLGTVINEVGVKPDFEVQQQGNWSALDDFTDAQRVRAKEVAISLARSAEVADNGGQSADAAESEPSEDGEASEPSESQPASESSVAESPVAEDEPSGEESAPGEDAPEGEEGDSSEDSSEEE